MINHSIYGIGINDGKYPSKINNKNTLTYDLWHRMLRRCYCISTQNKQPTYNGCTVSDNFKYYSYFHEWCQEQVGFSNLGWHLDKDILFKKNKLYSENTCIFVPRDINNLFLKCDAARGECPIGVSFNKREKKFVAYVYDNSKRQHLGYFNNSNDAFLAYKEAKEVIISRYALQFKDLIDPRTYEALISYKVEMGD